MTAPLPDPLVTAEGVFGAIPGFGSERVDTIIALGGGNHRTFLMSTVAARYVLRLSGRDAAPDIANEHAVLALMSAADLAPEPLYADPARGVLLTRFLEGRTLVPEDLTDAAMLDRIAEALARVHLQVWSGRATDPVAATLGYLAVLESDDQAGQQATAIRCRLDALAGALDPGPAPALCHNDLMSGNIHIGNRLRFVDWEYAGGGDPWFDIATLICYHDMSMAARSALVEAYRRYSGRYIDKQRLDALCALVDCQTLAWSLARSAGGASRSGDGGLARSAARRLDVQVP